MDSKGAAAAASTHVYEDFVPTTELVQEQDSDTLLLNLTGFKKEQVRVQLTRTGVLRISGQRPAGQNKWLRFQKDFPVSDNCDKNKISAKFENGILYVKQPKLITSAERKEKESPTPATQQPKKPADHEQHAQKKDQENAKHENTTPREELPKQANAEKALAKEPEKQAQKKSEAKELPEKPPAEKALAKEPEKQEPKKSEAKELPEKTPAEKALAKEPEKQEQKKSEAKELPEKTPAEKAGTSSTAEDGKGTSYERKLENDAKMETAAALAEKLKMPRKVMNMTLVAILVLGIGLYVSNMLKSNNYQAEE